MKKIEILRFVFILLICSFLFTACGGGTSGTGGNNRVKRIEGTLLEKVSSSPLAGVNVRLAETGSESVTNNSGDFVIIVSVDLEQAQFNFSGNGLNDFTIVSNIPDSARVIDLEFGAETDSGKVDLEASNYEDILSGGEFCDAFPDDPTCEEELDDFCLNFPEDPFCEDLFIDEYCFDFPEDPFCREEGEFLDDFELDYCEEFPEDEVCYDDEEFEEIFFDECEFEDDILCDENYLNEDCIEFPNDLDCIF